MVLTEIWLHMILELGCTFNSILNGIPRLVHHIYQRWLHIERRILHLHALLVLMAELINKTTTAVRSFQWNNEIWTLLVWTGLTLWNLNLISISILILSNLCLRICILYLNFLFDNRVVRSNVSIKHDPTHLILWIINLLLLLLANLLNSWL